jgi:hypothetical protein
LQRHHSLFASLLLLSAANAQSLPVLADPPAATTSPQNAILPSPSTQKAAIREFGRLPLSFELNQGQADQKVRFLTHSADSTLSLTSSEAVFTMPAHPGALRKDSKGRRPSGTPSTGTLRMQLLDADPHARALQQQPLEGRVNYFMGKEPSKWHTDIPTFGKVGFHAVYPGVDVVYYGNQQCLEYDFVVAPHADPRQIKLWFGGAQDVRVNAAGELIVRAQGRELTWRKPTVYQQNATGKHAVVAHYRLKRLPNGEAGVTFALGRYDTARPLVIDPVLTYSTYLSFGFPANAVLAVDSAGSAYIASTISTIFQSYIQIIKLNATGTALVYTTTLGPQASSVSSAASRIAVDSTGSAYLTGDTDASNFPTTVGAFKTQRSTAYRDVFVTKLNPAGDGLTYSTFIGAGTASCLALDSSGSAYITGSTSATDFPVTPGAFQAVNHAPTHSNAFITKLNATGTGLVYSTYLGGSVDLSNDAFYTDNGQSIAVDANGNAYIAGTTASTDFPTTPGAFQRVNRISDNRFTTFVTKLNATGTALLYSTYLGGTREDTPHGIAVDSSGNACIVGQTISTDLPTTPGAFQRTFPQLDGHYTAFVTKLNPTGTGLIYCTYLGGTYQGGPYPSQDTPNSIAVDSSGNAYVTGTTTSSGFPTTIGALKRVQNPQGYPNAFVTKFNPTGTALIYSTLLGGTFQHAGNNLGDAGDSIAIDSAGNVYVAGSTQSGDFPTTPGAFLATPASAFATKLTAVPILPDFNNDGFTDLLIQNTSTNQIASWFMQGRRWIDGAYFSLTPPSDFALVGVGDFSGTGAATLVLQSRTTNQIAFWYATGTNGATISGGNLVNMTPGPGWKVVAVGDFNGDGKSDLVFQNQTTGQIALWYMNGYLYQDGNSLDVAPLPGWQVVGAGDFNKDGFTDLVFQNQTTGRIALWYMHGKTYAGGTILPSVPAAGWKVVGVGDYNGDGGADLLFQNQTTNQAVVWYLQNGVYAGGDLLSLTPPSGWKIVGPR